MVVQCPSCLTKFSVDPTAFAKFLNPRFHCTRCGHYFTSPASSVKMDNPSQQRSGGAHKERRRSAGTDDAEQLELLPKAAPKGSSPKKHRRVERSAENSSPIEDDDDISVTAQWCDDSGQIQYEADLGQIHPVAAEVIAPAAGRTYGSQFAGRISAAAVQTRAIDYKDRPRPLDPSSESLKESGIELFEPDQDNQSGELFVEPAYSAASARQQNYDRSDTAPAAEAAAAAAAARAQIENGPPIVAEWNTPDFESSQAVFTTSASAISAPADQLSSASESIEAEWSFDSTDSDNQVHDSFSAGRPSAGGDFNTAISGEPASGCSDRPEERAADSGRYELEREGFSFADRGRNSAAGYDIPGPFEGDTLRPGVEIGDPYQFGQNYHDGAAGPAASAARTAGSFGRFAAALGGRVRPGIGPVFGSLLKSAVLLSVPLFVLTIFLRLTGFLGSDESGPNAASAPLRVLVSIGESRLPRSAPAGLELTDIKPEIIALDSGEEVVQLSGNVLNTTKKKIVEAVIEAQTFSSSAQPLEQVRANFSNGLTNAARIGALSTTSLLELQTREGIKEVRLNPNERAPFKLVVPAAAGKAAWFSARISQVRYEVP